MSDDIEVNPSADVHEQRRAFAAVLDRHADSVVVAVGRDGLTVPLPDTLELGPGHRTIESRSLLDLVVPQSVRPVIEAWEQAKLHGIGECIAQLVADATTLIRVRIFDLSEPHGAFIGMLTPAGTATATALDVVQSVPIRPRLGRMKKNAAGVIVAADADLCEILGFDEHQLVGKRSLDFVHPDDQPPAVDAWLEMLGNRHAVRRIRLRHLRGDGEFGWMELANHNQLDENAEGFVVTEMLDISDEMRAQEQLRAREQLLDRLAQALPLGVIHFDTEGAIVYRNDRAAVILGADGDTFDDLFQHITDDDGPRLMAAAQSVFATGEPEELEVTLEFERRRRVCNVRLRALTEESEAVSGAIMAITDTTESAAMRKELHVRATFDSLTGTLNRESTVQTLEALLGNPSAGLTVVYLDLDKFKAVNDTFGHSAGDAVLESVTRRLLDAVREGDVVGRLGGDEFLVICPDTPSVEVSVMLAQRFEELARHDLEVDGRRIRVSATTGPAWTSDPALTADELIARADAAMYEAKNRRKAQEALVDSVPSAEEDAAELRRALADREFELAYQPIMHVPSDRVWGVEALLRWRRGDELVAAGSFMPIAESTGVISDIGRWVVDELCREIAASESTWRRDLTWFVNLTPAELSDNVALDLIAAMSRHGVHPGQIVVEVSERSDLEASPSSVAGIEALAQAGVAIGLDDFGTGYSSLVRLRQLPLTWLKIDREFTSGDSPEQSLRFLSALQDLGRAMGLRIIVEGVEEMGQREMLLDLGIELAQGYLFQPAMALGNLFPVGTTGTH